MQVRSHTRMDRAGLAELHYITPIANLASIMANGLLSHRRAQAYNPVSVALQDVQDRRAGKSVPGGLRLHEYVNFYFCARNPMLYKRLGQRHALCVLKISTDALDIEGAVITDMNAASKYVRFLPSPAGLEFVDEELVFAERWTHPDDPVRYYRHSAVKCAEVLVPHRVGPELIRGACVCSEAPRGRINALGLGFPVSIDHYMFFNQP